jgi:hypothetical protein
MQAQHHTAGTQVVAPNTATTISGTVRNAAAAGLPNIEVWTCGGGDCYDATTAGDGTYSVAVAPNNNYVLEFDDPSGTYASGYYSSSGFTTDYDVASAVRVTSSAVSGIDITLPGTIHISGTVRNAAAAGLPNIDVRACPTSPGFCYNATTAGNGTYSVGVAPNLSYILEFDDYSGMYAGGWYSTSGFTTDPDAASAVSVTSSDVSGKDITLPGAIHISGTVRNAAAAGLPNIDVWACAIAGGFCYYATTAGDGTYSVGAAPNLSYVLEFDDYSGTYASGYYSTSGFTSDYDAASAVRVTSSAVSGIDITLPGTIHISGTVRNAAAAGLPGIDVRACPITSGFCYYATTAGNGTYSVRVAPNGSYQLWFSDSAGTYGEGYYSTGGFTYDYGAASSVSVTSSDVSGKDVILPLAGATYIPLNPTRLLDTRSNVGLSGPFSSHVARPFQVTGAVVPAGATAVTGNLTVTQQTSAGFLFIGPVAMNNPTSSTLNFPLGDDRANAVTVALSVGGTLSVTYAASTLGPTAQVIFDVTGYFVPNTSGATYIPLNPTRLLDSRDHTGGLGIFSSHVAQSFTVTGHGGVPSNAIAVTGNLTVTQQTSGGFLSVGPVAQNNPTSSTLNFPVGDDRANAVTVALSTGGALSVTYAASTLGPTAQVIFDVTGYFVPNMSGATYIPLNPARLLDTRNGTGLAGPSSSHVARTFQVTGSGVPAGVYAVTGNLTVTQQTSAGFLFIGPVAMNNPTSSTLNFPLGDDRANAVTVALGTGGTLRVTYAASTLGPTAQVIFDVTGYFVP